jgi:hypothetical protein
VTFRQLLASLSTFLFLRCAELISGTVMCQVTVLPSNLMETELAGPKINVYIKPNRNLGPTCTLDPTTLLAMVDDAKREAARDLWSKHVAVPELRLRGTTTTLLGIFSASCAWRRLRALSSIVRYLPSLVGHCLRCREFQRRSCSGWLCSV